MPIENESTPYFVLRAYGVYLMSTPSQVIGPCTCKIEEKAKRKKKEGKKEKKCLKLVIKRVGGEIIRLFPYLNSKLLLLIV